MAINSVRTISFVKSVVNSGKNLHGVKPKIKVNFNEADKFLYVTAPLKNPATGNTVATFPSDLPPLKDGWVRLIHRTEPHYTAPILNEGLRGKYGISGTTTLHSSDGFWKNLALNELGFHGTKKVVMDMPAKEYTKLFRNDNYYKKGSVADPTGYNNARNLYVKNKYIIGIIDAYGPHKQMTQKQLAAMKKSSEMNPFLDIKPEDLRQLNLGRPQNRDFYGRTPSQARKEIEKAQKEIAKKVEQKPSEYVSEDAAWDIWD